MPASNSAKAWPSLRSWGSASTRCKATARAESSALPASRSMRIDLPMNHKDEIYVRSHYDGMSVVLPDAPMPDEIAVIFCIANRGRLNARVGGLTHEEVSAKKRGKPS